MQHEWFPTEVGLAIVLVEHEGLPTEVLLDVLLLRRFRPFGDNGRVRPGVLLEQDVHVGVVAILVRPMTTLKNKHVKM